MELELKIWELIKLSGIGIDKMEFTPCLVSTELG